MVWLLGASAVSGTRRRQSLTDGPLPQSRVAHCGAPPLSVWPPSSIDSSFSHTQLTSCRLHRYVSTSFTLPPVPCSSFELRACSRACSHAASIPLVFPLRPRASLFPSPGRLDGWMCGYLTHQCHHLSSVVRLSAALRFVDVSYLTSGNLPRAVLLSLWRLANRRRSVWRPRRPRLRPRGRP